MDNSINIISGKSVEIAVDWFTTANLPETPTAVRYQVFDWLTGASIAASVAVTELASSMVFVVPASLLPGDTTPTRHLVVEIEGTFTSDKDIERAHIYVSKGFMFT